MLWYRYTAAEEEHIRTHYRLNKTHITKTSVLSNIVLHGNSSEHHGMILKRDDMILYNMPRDNIMM